MKHSPLEKLVVIQLVKKSPASYGNQSFITIFTEAYSESDETSPHSHILFLYYPFNIILPSMLVPSSGLFPSDSTTEILYAFSSLPLVALSLETMETFK